MNLPPSTHVDGALARLRVFCGDAELTPIHAFTLDTPLPGGDSAVREALFAFAPDALGPSCGTARMMLYSEKNPQKPDTKTLDAAVLAHIAQDFEPFRQQP